MGCVSNFTEEWLRKKSKTTAIIPKRSWGQHIVRRGIQCIIRGGDQKWNSRMWLETQPGPLNWVVQKKTRKMPRESLCGAFMCVTKLDRIIQYSLRQVKSNLDTLGKKVIYEIVQINPSWFLWYIFSFVNQNHAALLVTVMLCCAFFYCFKILFLPGSLQPILNL